MSFPVSFKTIPQQEMIFRNARLLHAQDESGMDLWIRGGRVHAIERSGVIPTGKAGSQAERDCQGLWILPGLVDAHVHLREPGLEHKETIASGTAASVAGGFTTVACMANTKPVNDTAAITRSILAQAAQTAACRVQVVGAITQGLQGKQLAELGSMIEAGAVALSDDGMPVMDSALMRHAMDYAKSFNVPIISHAEDLHLSHGGCMHEGAHSFKLGLPGIPAASEEIAVARDIALCRLTGVRLHIAHISTRQALALVRTAKREGLPITAEVTPHHLSLTDACWESYSTACKMNPPLRTREDVEALIEGLADGTIDLIATDHAPHAVHEKAEDALTAPNGVIGLQTAIPLTLETVHAGRVAPLRWAQSLTSSPARMLGLDAGRLEVGGLADLCIINPLLEWTWNAVENHSLSSNIPPFQLRGKSAPPLRGKVAMTWLEGRKVFEDRPR